LGEIPSDTFFFNFRLIVTFPGEPALRRPTHRYIHLIIYL
jgi:hypothetical protein